MLLYHGTAERFADQILTEGLKPRGNRKGNWGHSVNSNKDAVYLTNAYAPYFSISAVKNLFTEKAFVVEVDTDKLNPWNLTPDEDALEQLHRYNPNHFRDGPPMDWSMEKRTKWFRSRLKNWYAGPEYAEKSLKLMGNCAYFGEIPKEAISKAILIDGNKAPATYMSFMDPTISIMNYMIVGAKYRSLTRWLFGRELDKADLVTAKVVSVDGESHTLWSLPDESEREGIQVLKG